MSTSSYKRLPLAVIAILIVWTLSDDVGLIKGVAAGAILGGLVTEG